MKERIHINYNEKQYAILEARDRIRDHFDVWLQATFWEVGGNRDHPTYRKIQSRYFRAIKRIQAIALHRNLSVVERTVQAIGTMGILSTLNWCGLETFLFTQEDKTALLNAKPEVLRTLFQMLDNMPVCAIARQVKNTTTGKLSRYIDELYNCDLHQAQNLASLATWVEIKVEPPLFLNSSKLGGIIPDRLKRELVITKGFASAKNPYQYDTKLYPIRLQLFSHFRRHFLSGEPIPIENIYIIQVTPSAYD